MDLTRPLRQRAYSQAEMIAEGAGGSLTRAYARYVPMGMIEGLEPRPSNNESEDGEYHPGRPITNPVELAYDAANNVYVLYAGNHRYTQAHANHQTHILAFVEPDRSQGRDFIGGYAARENPDQAITVNEDNTMPHTLAFAEYLTEYNQLDGWLRSQEVPDHYERSILFEHGIASTEGVPRDQMIDRAKSTIEQYLDDESMAVEAGIAVKFLPVSTLR